MTDPDRIARLVDLLGNLATTAAEVARVLAEGLPPTVGEADPCLPDVPIEHADRHTIEQWGRANHVPASLDAINDLRLRHGLAVFRMIAE